MATPFTITAPLKVEMFARRPEVSGAKYVPMRGVEFDGFVVLLSKKDQSNRSSMNAKTRVYGACDDLVADLNEMEPPYIAFTDEHSPATDRVAEKMWRAWRDETKKVAGERLGKLLTALAERGVEGLELGEVVNGPIKFSYKAGCSVCPCSPGFILDGQVEYKWWGTDLSIASAASMERVVGQVGR